MERTKIKKFIIFSVISTAVITFLIVEIVNYYRTERQLFNYCESIFNAL